MEAVVPPRTYPEWRGGKFDRAEDAAYSFGYYLMQHCRDEAMATIPPDSSAELKAAVAKAVDEALHNVCDMLEGFWPLNSGPEHKLSFALGVQVRNSTNQILETQEISPCKLDLPIGYWKWSQEREFR
jgi:hypothetical protein